MWRREIVLINKKLYNFNKTVCLKQKSLNLVMGNMIQTVIKYISESIFKISGEK